MTRGNPFPPRSLRPIHRAPKWGDRIFFGLTLLGALGLAAVIIAMVVSLVHGALPAFYQINFDSFLFGHIWNPDGCLPPPIGFGPCSYGALPFIVGTLVTSAIALLIAIPLALGAAIFLTQHAPLWMREPVAQIIQLLAAVPSVVYGFWALIVLVPIMATDVNPVLAQNLGWTGLFGGPHNTGLDVLTASLVLSIMTIPTITAISRDAMEAVPRSQKEAAISLGATPWEVTRRAVVPYSRSGIIAGIVLGLGRALGETMAVTMTIGNRDAIPTSLFSQGQTIASLFANEFTEAISPLEIPALIEMALLLLGICLAINIGARLVLARLQLGGRTTTE